MFQTFEQRADPSKGSERLARLRARLAELGCDGFILPRTDAHQSEQLAPHDERLAWLTGFTGSAGTAVILADRAVIFTDGRYTVQIAGEVDTALFEIVNIADHSPGEWLGGHAGAGIKLGYDPWLLTPEGLERLEHAGEKSRPILVPLDDNPIDQVWIDQPPPPTGAITPHPLEFAGVGAGEKLAGLRQSLAADGDRGLILNLGASIAWAFNIRGSDIAHTPVPLAFAVVTADAATIFCDPAKISPATRSWLAPHAAAEPQDRFAAALDRLGSASASVRIDPASTPCWIARRLEDAGARLRHAADPCIAARARKNEVEIAGARTAHARDAVVLARFLCWLDAEAPSGRLDEIAAVRRLEEFRAETGALMDISFETIAGAGPNGAIVHYRVSERTNRKIEPGTLFLVDSGAQYRDGTTDVTRTIAVGTPSGEMRRLFTLVLKGHIAIAAARFPAGTSGAQLDSLARIALWRAGHDYDHGTGHGVGSYLSVHEGPQGISKRGTVALEPGMIVSNEPGVYLEGRFGIRIENLLLVTAPEPVEGGARDMLGFETLTLAPIDRSLIDAELLTAAERAWVDAYHARVRDAVLPHLGPATGRWVTAATAPLGRS
jgi:Xaa-Pro aminopeptidase